MIYNTDLGLSYIVVQIPKGNQTFESLEYMRLDFTFENAFRRLSRSEYELVLTLGGNFHKALEEVAMLDEIKARGILWDLAFFNSKSARLDLERPENQFYSLEFTPLAYSVGYWHNRTWYRWDVKSLSSGVLSSSIIAEIQDENYKSNDEIKANLSWFLFGLGIPMLISSGYKIWEEPRLKIEPKSKPNYYSKMGMGKRGFYPMVVENIGNTMIYECEATWSISSVGLSGG